MIRDIISYAGDIILTIYHKGFDNELGNRKIKRVNKIGRYNIIFEEEIVEDAILDNLTNCDGKLEGLLGTSDIRNPYGERVCAYMTQYLYFDKPKKLFLLEEDKYRLSISPKLLNQIILFTKKYTGLNLQNQAMCFGDTFVYECHQVHIHAKGDEGVIIKVDSSEYKIIVNFKLDNIIACTIIENIQDGNAREIEILSDKKWNNADIQIYDGNKLVYYKQDISFMQTMVLNTTVKGSKKRIELNKLGTDFEVDGGEYTSKNIIGKQPDEIRSLIMQSNHSIKQRLLEGNDNDSKFLFISPNELEKARDYIVSVLRSDSDEVWIFDPYFSDRNGITISLDWIRILAYCKASSKHIVFWNNEARDPITVDEFAEICSEDRAIMDSKGKGTKLGIHFYQLKTYIHDRFIFAVNKEKITGITVGTSLNSLDSNYYCINTLSHVSSRKAFESLKNLIGEANIEDYATI